MTISAGLLPKATWIRMLSMTESSSISSYDISHNIRNGKKSQAYFKKIISVHWIELKNIHYIFCKWILTAQGGVVMIFTGTPVTTFYDTGAYYITIIYDSGGEFYEKESVVSIPCRRAMPGTGCLRQFRGHFRRQQL